ncbi:flagellar biosynthetic protein FliO [Blastochloris tepida]|uniref:Flagellar biosynthesis protein FliO n=1 Tax=Blastochloris tepida TaxID=2233851 RepID=A0A348FX22_9HYPH|nr:flagellar biosynthetic protein FliO [Blastochloris tepida]BBF91855.1 hypothetical protein BLTE_05400 [Blastochloris tepida]
MSDILGVELGTFLKYLAALLFVLGLLGGTLFLVRKLGGGTAAGGSGGRGRMPRLGVLDHAVVDARRRLVLIRRDNVEHLIMIGGPTDVVIETGIIRSAPPQREGTQARDAYAEARAGAGPQMAAPQMPAPQMPGAVPPALPAEPLAAPARPDLPPRTEMPLRRERPEPPARPEAPPRAAPARTPEPATRAESILRSLTTPQRPEPAAPAAPAPGLRPLSPTPPPPEFTELERLLQPTRAEPAARKPLGDIRPQPAAAPATPPAPEPRLEPRVILPAAPPATTPPAPAAPAVAPPTIATPTVAAPIVAAPSVSTAPATPAAAPAPTIPAPTIPAPTVAAPAAEAPSAPAAPAAATPAPEAPAQAAAGPTPPAEPDDKAGRTVFDNLEDEMASLLGRGGNRP